MMLRRWLSVAAITAGMAFGVPGVISAAEKEKEKKTEFNFGTMRTTAPETARTQAEAWLKTTGKFNAESFTKIWNKNELSVLEKVTETLVLGSDDAKKLLAEAQASEKSAPKAVPALLKDAKQNAFFRANLALAYAKSLASARVYEESLDTLKAVNPELVVDPSSYFFHKAVAEHALTLKDEAVRTILRLIDDVGDAPDRYKMVATIMFIDMQGWKKDEKDLSNIAKLMDNVERRLELARGGKKTQEIQSKIVFRLDELIKEKENQAKSAGAGNGGNCPSGGAPGSGSGPGSNQPSSPMQDSNIATNGGNGTVDEKKIKALADKWGIMPEHERAKALQDVTKDLPPKFKIVIEDYFKSISRATP